MSPSDRESLIRAALLGVAAEMAELDTSKSGAVTVHFQNGLPMKVKWEFSARPLTYAPAGARDSRDDSAA